LTLCSSPPEFVFIENGPNVLHLIDKIIGPMLVAGYRDARWSVCGGLVFKARHRRRRAWLLFRHSHSRSRPCTVDVRTCCASVAGDFAAPGTDLACALHRPVDMDEELQRCALLGDAVLVPVARYMAIALLCGCPATQITGASAVFAPLTHAWNSSLGRLVLGDRIRDGALPGPFHARVAGAMVDGIVYDLPADTFTGRQTIAGIPMGPLLLPTEEPQYLRQRAPPELRRRVQRPTQMRLLATPRHCVWRPQVFLTRRGCGDLVTQLLHCDAAPPGVLFRRRRGRHAVRASWLERLMGFRPHHTRLRSHRRGGAEPLVREHRGQAHRCFGHEGVGGLQRAGVQESPEGPGTRALEAGIEPKAKRSRASLPALKDAKPLADAKAPETPSD